MLQEQLAGLSGDVALIDLDRAAGLCAADNLYVLWVLAFGGLFDWVLVHSASLLACGYAWRAAGELPMQPGLRPHEV